MIDNFTRLYTKRDFEKIREDKVISLQFILNYLSFDNENRHTAMVLNKYLYKVNDKILWDILFLSMPPKNFIWNSSYIGKKAINTTPTQERFKERVCKVMGWSKREFEIYTELVELLPEEKERLAERLALTNKERVALGLFPHDIPIIEKLEKGQGNQKGLGEWFS